MGDTLSNYTKGITASQGNILNLPCKRGHIGSWIPRPNSDGTITRTCIECKRARTRLEHKSRPQLYVRLKKDKEARLKSGLCINCPTKVQTVVVVGHRYCEVCLAKRRKSNRDTVQRAKDVIFAYYGKVCVCCGENTPKFLTIDHVNNNGKADRGKQTATSWYLRLAKRIRLGDPPTDLRILCYNCNCGRSRNGGVCPHEEVSLG